MRPDGQLERHDQIDDYKMLEPSYDTTRKDVGADILTLYNYVAEALALWQGYYIPKPQAPLNGYFLHAWSLKEGQLVDNTTIGTTYKIEEIERDPKTNEPTGYVMMSGSPDPDISHRLKFRPEDSLVFMHSFGKTYAHTYNFSATGDGTLVSEHSAPWRDTITWLLSRKEPGSLSGEPFKRPRTLVPMPRRYMEYPANDDYIVDTEGQWFDCLVQFDCWTQTNHTAELLVKWFEEFMMVYTGVFTFNGLSRVIFWERAVDELVTRWRDDIVNRTIRYYVRTETVTATLEAKIRSILAVIGLAATGEVTGDILGGGTLPIPAIPGETTIGTYENRDS